MQNAYADNDNHGPVDSRDWMPVTHILLQRQRPPEIAQAWFRMDQIRLWAPSVLGHRKKPANQNKRVRRYKRWS